MAASEASHSDSASATDAGALPVRDLGTTTDAGSEASSAGTRARGRGRLVLKYDARFDGEEVDAAIAALTPITASEDGDDGSDGTGAGSDCDTDNDAVVGTHADDRDLGEPLVPTAVAAAAKAAPAAIATPTTPRTNTGSHQRRGAAPQNQPGSPAARSPAVPPLPPRPQSTSKSPYVKARRRISAALHQLPTPSPRRSGKQHSRPKRIRGMSSDGARPLQKPKAARSVSAPVAPGSALATEPDPVPESKKQKRKRQKMEQRRQGDAVAMATPAGPGGAVDAPTMIDLSLSGLGLQDCPSTITKLASAEISLLRLDLSHNTLHTWPEQLFRSDATAGAGAALPSPCRAPCISIAHGLKELDLSDNELSTLPEEALPAFTALRLLELADNKLRFLPAQIAELSSLRYLGLANNSLVQLPLEMLHMKPASGASGGSLAELNVHGNTDLTSPPLNVCCRPLHAADGLFEYFDTLQRATTALDRYERRLYLSQIDAALIDRVGMIARECGGGLGPRQSADGAGHRAARDQAARAARAGRRRQRACRPG